LLTGDAHEERKKCVPTHPVGPLLECRKDKGGKYHQTGHGRYSVRASGIIMDPCKSKGDKIKNTCSGKKCCVPKNPKKVPTNVSRKGQIRECKKKNNGKYATSRKGGDLVYMVTNKGKKMDPCKSPNFAFQDKKGKVCCIKGKK
jgi:hypothetical protein